MAKFDIYQKDWRPIDNGVIVSVRCPAVFGDDQIRRGRVVGWHISTGNNPDRKDPFEEPQPVLEYEVKFLKTQRRHFIPAENVLGFLRGVQPSKT